jgi:phosphonate transport system substrate-binding protein
MKKISSLPEENRSRAFRMSKNLRNLLKDAEVLMTELNRFKLITEEEIAILKMGVIPLESPAEMYRRFTPLTYYLTRKLNKTVELKIEVDFARAIKDIGDGVTNICYMTPSTYIQASEKYGVEVLVKALRNGKPYHHTVIIAKEKGKINRIEDIKGNSFAFGDSLSTSSHIVPRAMLKEAGIDLEDLSFYDFLGHHDDVALAVLNGEFDAGGVMESTAERFKEQGLKFLKYSKDIPEFNICVSKDMPEEEKLMLKKALLELDSRNPEHKAILQSIAPAYTGFTEAKHEDYVGIKKIMQELGLLK